MTTTTTKTPKTKAQVPCWCGCGGLTKSRFVPGHDARLHGAAKKAARGEVSLEALLASLPHAEAKADAQKHHDAEVPKAAAKAAATAAAKAAKEAAKAAAAEAKAAAEEATKAAEEATESTDEGNADEAQAA